MTLAEWKLIAHELRGTRFDTPPAGLHERLEALLAQTPRAWLGQPFAIELDDSSIESVWAVHEAVTSPQRSAGDQRDGVDAAMQIVHNHQQRPGDGSPAREERP